MQSRLRFTILGCGSSPGTPRLTNDWGACDPGNPRNRRLRASLMIERVAADDRRTVVVIDTGPDFREQMIANRVMRLDGVAYTHAHADHIHGIDDLRGFALALRRRIDVWADDATLRRLREAFGYCFETPPGSDYPPIVDSHLIAHDRPFAIEGPGGRIVLEPLPQRHGSIMSLGFRVGSVAYCPDVSAFPERTLSRIEDLDVLILDALQYKAHPSHLSLEQALQVIEHVRPRQSYLTHMHIPLDYETVLRETPPHVEPAFDGLVFEVPFPDD